MAPHILINIKRCSAVGTAAAAVLLMCAAFTPQWTYSLGTTTSAGPRGQCGVVRSALGTPIGVGMCQHLDVRVATSLSKCCKGDTKKFTRYLRTLETFSWIGAVSMVLAVATAFVGTTDTVVTPSWAGPLHFLNILGLCSFIIALSMGVSMYDIHGPRALCKNPSPSTQPCAYMGTAAVTGIVALATAVFAAFFGIFAHAMPTQRKWLLRATLFLAAVSASFAISSSLTPSWVHFMSGPNAIQSTGTLQVCDGTYCKAFDHKTLAAAGTCHGKDISGQIKSRFAATTAMMVIGSVFAGAAAVVSALPKMRTVRMALIFLAFVAVASGLAVIGNTYQEWLLCGENYFGKNPAVRWGVSFGFAVFSAIVLGVLLAMNVFNTMWGSAVNARLSEPSAEMTVVVEKKL